MLLACQHLKPAKADDVILVFTIGDIMQVSDLMNLIVSLIAGAVAGGISARIAISRHSVSQTIKGSGPAVGGNNTGGVGR